MNKPFDKCDISILDIIPKDKINWHFLCGNPNAIPLIDRLWDTIQDKIIWALLCSNPNAIPLLEKRWDTIQDNIRWDGLCCNPNAIPLLDKRWDTIQDNIRWYSLSNNINIFVDEYVEVCKNYFKKDVSEELMKVVWHPKNINKFQYLLGENTNTDEM